MTAEVPIVLIHGVRLSGTSWAVFIDQLGAERSVRAVNLPGHGARRGERFTLATAVDAVLDAIDELGGRAIVVGHSLGGYVGIAAAARAPERVAGLVVAGSSCAPNRVLATPFRVMHRVLSRQPDGGEEASGRLFERVLPASVAAAVVRGGIATEAIPDVVQALSEFDVLTALGSYPGPVWLINGGHDHFRVHERRFLAACAQGRLLVIPRAGHYLPLAQPATFARLVRDAAAAIESRCGDQPFTTIAGTPARLDSVAGEG